MDFLITNMIIKLEFSIEQLDSFFDKEELSELFSEVARASILGYHRIIINRSTVKWCVDNLDLTKKHCEHLVKIGQNFSQLGGQYNSAKKRVLVVPFVDKKIVEMDCEWVISVKEFLEGKYLEPSVLLLEHARNDGDFYNLMLSLNAKNSGFGDIYYDVFHGGGSSSGVELERIASQNRIIACVCDSDRKTPYGAASATHNAVFAVAERINVIGVVQSTPGREAENFLPLSIVSKFTTENEAIEKIESLVRNQGSNVKSKDCIWLYFDIKGGIPAGKLSDYCKSKECLEWVSRKYNVDIDSVSEIEFPALGQNILSQFMKVEEAKGEFHRFVRSQYWKTHCLSWVEEILWVVSGNKKKRLS